MASSLTYSLPCLHRPDDVVKFDFGPDHDPYGCVLVTARQAATERGDSTSCPIGTTRGRRARIPSGTGSAVRLSPFEQPGEAKPGPLVALTFSTSVVYAPSRA
jgi:hypothetical protein